MKGRLIGLLILGFILVGAVVYAQEQPEAFYGTWFIDGTEYHCACEVAKPTPSPTPTPIPPPPKLYGYASYRRLGALPLEELAEYSNFLYVFHQLNTGSPTTAELQAVRDAGLKIVLKLSSRAVEDEWNETALLNLKARIDPYKEVIVALGVIDEPYKPSKGWAEVDLEALVNRVGAVFPEYNLHVNFLAPYYTEMVTDQPFPNIPENIDLISTDIYIHLPETSGPDEYLMRIRRNLDIIQDRAGERPIFYFAPAYGVQDRSSSWPTVEQAWLDYDLFAEYDLLGLNWYFYEETATVSVGGRPLALWGASHFPGLMEAHRDIGTAILGEEPTPTPTPEPPTPIPTPIVGETKTWLAMRVVTSRGGPECSEGVLVESLFGPTNSVNAAYSESSQRTLGIAGDVTTVSVPGTISCTSRSAWASVADAAAAAQGYNVGEYDYRAYILPRGTCMWAGNVDIRDKRLYTTRCEYPKILAHEMGHAIGTYHAGLPGSEYGDNSCIMGAGAKPIVQFNGPHRVGLGWANVATVTGSGTYTLVATELDNHVILRFSKDAGTYYYLSYRAPIGVDANLGTGYVNRVSVHTFPKTPSPGVNSRSILIATLGPGESTILGTVSVTCLSVGEEAATIQVEIGARGT